MFQSKYLPKPPNYGFVNRDFTLPIRSVRPQPIQLHDVDWLDGLMRDAAPTIEMPDIVKAQWGAGDPGIVGAMYRQLAGNEPELVGVSNDFIRRLLDQWGYPQNPADWTADQFDAELAARALEPNPVAVLSGQQQGVFGG